MILDETEIATISALAVNTLKTSEDVVQALGRDEAWGKEWGKEIAAVIVQFDIEVEQERTRREQEKAAKHRVKTVAERSSTGTARVIRSFR